MRLRQWRRCVGRQRGAGQCCACLPATAAWPVGQPRPAAPPCRAPPRTTEVAGGAGQEGVVVQQVVGGRGTSRLRLHPASPLQSLPSRSHSIATVPSISPHQPDLRKLLHHAAHEAAHHQQRERGPGRGPRRGCGGRQALRAAQDAQAARRLFVKPPAGGCRRGGPAGRRLNARAKRGSVAVQFGDSAAAPAPGHAARARPAGAHRGSAACAAARCATPSWNSRMRRLTSWCAACLGCRVVEVG